MIKKKKKKEITVKHEDNEWGISVIDESCDETSLSINKPPEGAIYAFEKPSSQNINNEDTVQLSDDEDLSSLMGQLNSLKE